MKTPALLLLGMFAASVGLAAEEDLEPARLALRTKQFDAGTALLQRAAQSGAPEALYLLGLAQWNGIGTPADLAAARRSLESAARQDHARAAYALAALLAAGPAPAPDAAGWLAKSAELGYAPAVALRDAHRLPYADARLAGNSSDDARFEIARHAARSGDLALLGAALDTPLANRPDEYGRTVLFDAATAGSAAPVEALLRAGARATAADRFGVTPLMLAAASADAGAARALMAAGAPADAVDKAGRSALFRAAAADRPEQIKLLIAAGAAADRADGGGATAADVAARVAAEGALAALAAAGAKPGTKTVATGTKSAGLDPSKTGALYRGWAPLAVAAVRDDVGEARRLIGAGADVNSLSPAGLPALALAVEAGAKNVIPVLLAAGADPHRAGRPGDDALTRAVRNGNPAMLDLLHTGGVIPTAAESARLLELAAARGDEAMTRSLFAAGADGKGAAGTAALLAAARAAAAGTVKLLIDRGADVDSHDAAGRSPLWHAAAADSSACAEVLLAVHAKVDAADHDGVTPLIAAARTGSERIAARLLEAGADVDARDKQGDTALSVAAALGRAGLVTELLRRHADVDATDEHRETALMAAARAGHADVCELLLAAGAKTSLRNHERATAVDIAEARGFAKLAQRLAD